MHARRKFNGMRDQPKQISIKKSRAIKIGFLAIPFRLLVICHQSTEKAIKTATLAALAAIFSGAFKSRSGSAMSKTMEPKIPGYARLYINFSHRLTVVSSAPGIWSDIIAKPGA